MTESNTTIDLGSAQWPTNGPDFLRLRLKANYSPLWKLRKPEQMQLEISRADGSKSLRTFVIEPGKATDVWFYPWDESDLSRYFDADESRWRPSDRPAVTGLKLVITPMDWFSQKMSSIELQSADAVSAHLEK